MARRPKYVVRLSPEERAQLRDVIRRGRHRARRVTRARILLKAADGLPDAAIAAALDVGTATVHRIRQRCVEAGPTAALADRPRPGAMPALDAKAQAHVIALACSTPPAQTGRARWTLRLLADRVVELGLAPHCSYETIRQVLKKTPSSRGSSSAGVSRRWARRS